VTPIEYAALATAIAQGLPHVIALLKTAGCAIAGCPADVEAEAAALLPADVPTGENQLAARDRIRARASQR
jgi:hypothetical protein